MKECAFLTMDSLDGFFCDDDLLYEPMAEIGWKVNLISWHKEGVDWQQFDAVVIRSTWDYDQAPEAFIKRLLEIMHAGTRLENNIELVRWNLRKTYLRDLQDRGATIVPTIWLRSPSEEQIRHCFQTLKTEGIVIKPVVGANARDAFRITAGEASDKVINMVSLYQEREAMIQPFARHILTEGEYSLFFFGGVYSHAILKKPESGDFRVQEEHGGQISPVTPENALLSAAELAIQKIQPLPLYARLDFVRLQEETFGLMELELIEPSLYFRMDRDAPKRFAKAFHTQMAAAL